MFIFFSVFVLTNTARAVSTNCCKNNISLDAVIKALKPLKPSHFKALMAVQRWGIFYLTPSHTSSPVMKHILCAELCFVFHL